MEGAIITSTHAGIGGAGDIAILTASDRLRLMPFAQIATRNGGGITVAGILAWPRCACSETRRRQPTRSGVLQAADKALGRPSCGRSSN